MTVSPQLMRASRIMAWLSLAGALATIAVTGLCFLAPSAVTAFDIRFDHADVALLAGAPLLYRLPALACALVPAGIAGWGLYCLADLFRCFASGEVFTARSLRALENVTKALFWNVVASFVAQAPVTYLLTMNNPPGHRAISLGFGSDDVEMLFLAGVAFVIARVMAEARRMADENAGFV